MPLRCLNTHEDLCSAVTPEAQRTPPQPLTRPRSVLAPLASLASLAYSFSNKHTMQCVKLLKKRALDLDPRDFCKTKRVCLGAELAECPMETCDSSNLTNQLQPVQKEQLKLSSGPDFGPGPGLLCQRCLRGEPGHIKHILGQL